MSLSVDFEPHSVYYEFVIHKTDYAYITPDSVKRLWEAYIDDGNTYRVVLLRAGTLKDLKREIVEYWFRDGGKHVPVFYEKKLLKSKEKLNV